MFDSCQPEGVAGGMSPRGGRRVTLAERGILPPVPVAAPGRHCWVVDPPGLPGRWAGLLIEWRQADCGWQGQVTFVAVLAGRAVLVQDWLDAVHLRPADAPGMPTGAGP
jgi:hypothetical protein